MSENKIESIKKWVDCGYNLPKDKVELLARIDTVQKLVIEELDELRKGIYDNDESEIYNAAADAIVVVCNVLTHCNLDMDKFNNELDKVIASNWTKYCATLEEALESQRLYAEGLHPNKPNLKIKVNIEPKGGVFILKNEINKIMKSHNFKDVHEV